MRGINKVIIAGNVANDARYQETGSGVPCATFKVACDRRGANKGELITSWIKVNVYGEGMVELCHSRLYKGGYLIVEGELMNRDGAAGEVTEVRAKEMVFIDTDSAGSYSDQE